MIASAVVGVCLLGVWALVRAGGRYLLVTNAKTELQRNAIFCIGRLSREFQETHDGSFQVGNGANGSVNRGVLFASPRDPDTGEIDYDDEGRMFWPKAVAFYQKTEAGIPCIVRTATKLPVRVSYPPPMTSLDQYLSTPLDLRILARHVTFFECTQPTPAILNVKIRCELPSGYGRKYGFEVETQVFARN
jgi:hypothetical protein